MTNDADRSPRRGRPPNSRGGSERGRDRRPRERDSRPRVSTSPRAAAFDVLMSVEESDGYANLLLPPLLRQRRIIGRDAALATELTYGTLRMQGRYDAIIDQSATRSVSDLDAPIRVALRLGVHQLLGMRVPPHAAVSETVALARDRISAGPAQLVNAVLRRVTERTLEEWDESLLFEDRDRTLSARHSHPDWIIRAFRQALGAPPTRATDVEESLEALLGANNAAPTVHLAVGPGSLGGADLGEAEVRPGRYARTARYLLGGDPGSLPAIRNGHARVQDEGSQLVTLAALDVEVDGSDETWLDICAGPGGKAALLASALADRGGGRFVANEIHPHRTKLVEQNLRSIPETVDVELRTSDGREIGDLEPGTYDRVLLDAPCTGLGALRRRPESRWRRTPADLPDLTVLQRGLLLSSLRCVRVGGLVAYITCSPHVAETALVVTDVLREAAKEGISCEEVDAPTHVNAVSRVPVEGLHGPYAQLWPQVHGTDAMYLALLRRVD